MNLWLILRLFKPGPDDRPLDWDIGSGIGIVVAGLAAGLVLGVLTWLDGILPISEAVALGICTFVAGLLTFIVANWMRDE